MRDRSSENIARINVHISATDLARLKIAGSNGHGGYSKFVRRAIRKLLALTQHSCHQMQSSSHAI